jgi:hypothetical protein
MLPVEEAGQVDLHLTRVRLLHKTKEARSVSSFFVRKLQCEIVARDYLATSMGDLNNK